MAEKTKMRELSLAEQWAEDDDPVKIYAPEEEAEVLKHNPYHGKDGRFTSGPGGAAGGAWAASLAEDKAKVLAMKPARQAEFVYDQGGETMDNCVAAMKNGQTKELVENYFAIMEANGDPTPTNPTSKQLNGELKDDVDSGKYSSYVEAREAYIKEMSGQSSEEAARTYDEMTMWFGASWERANTAVLDAYVESDHVYDGKIFRGMSFDEADYLSFMENVSPGAKIQMRRSSSWSSSEEVAAGFAHRADDRVSSVMIECVKNRTSSPVSHLSHQGEDEVLASSKAKWTVLHTETVKRAGGGYKTKITVVESGE